MHLDEGIMRSMSDGHLIASLRNTQDALTDTPVELELLRRLEKWQARADVFSKPEFGEVLDQLQDFRETTQEDTP